MNKYVLFSQSSGVMINVPSVYSLSTVSLRFSTALTHACVDCGHFVFPPGPLCVCPPPFSLPPPPPPLSPLSPPPHGPLNVPLREAGVRTRQTANCARPTQTSKSYLPPHAGPPESVRKMPVTSTC